MHNKLIELTSKKLQRISQISCFQKETKNRARLQNSTKWRKCYLESNKQLIRHHTRSFWVSRWDTSWNSGRRIHSLHMRPILHSLKVIYMWFINTLFCLSINNEFYIACEEILQHNDTVDKIVWQTRQIDRLHTILTRKNDEDRQRILLSRAFNLATNQSRISNYSFERAMKALNRAEGKKDDPSCIPRESYSEAEMDFGGVNRWR